MQKPAQRTPLPWFCLWITFPWQSAVGGQPVTLSRQTTPSRSQPTDSRQPHTPQSARRQDRSASIYRWAILYTQPPCSRTPYDPCRTGSVCTPWASCEKPRETARKPLLFAFQRPHQELLSHKPFTIVLILFQYIVKSNYVF